MHTINPLRLALCVAFFATFSAGTTTTLSAQDDWKTAKKKADDYYAKADYPKAGDAYMTAYKDKNKQEFAEKAAECFTISREYSALSAALEPLRSEKIERGGFKYANALKQSGRYSDAIREFQLYINNHKGKDYDREEKYVQLQIEGCHLGLKQQTKASSLPAPVRIAKICTTQTDYAPTLVGENLYFAAVVDGLSTIFTAEKTANGFGKPTPLVFTKTPNTHYGHPTVTEDGSRMYFTACTNVKGSKPTCQIYGMEMKNDKWSNPTKLPDFINLKDATATQPFVTIVDKKEQLYFVSDRKGGQGGMDIWVASRNTESEGYAFTLPTNLGATINTFYDELTPRVKDYTLYFASNGHISLGGFDVFSAKRKASGWDAPQNLGLPINSAADDAYYTPSAENTFFIVSNRAVKGEKTTTGDDDIFTNGVTVVENTSDMANLSGKIVDAATGKGVQGVMFSLVDEISGKEILTKTVNENFSVNVYPAMKYRLEARKEGFKPASVDFSSADVIADAVQNIQMVRLTDYKGNTAKVPEPEPIEQISDRNDPKLDDKTADATDKTPSKIDIEPDIKLDDPIKMPVETNKIESTIFYGDLSPEEKARIITIGGKKVLPEPGGNKLVSMEPLDKDEPKVADAPKTEPKQATPKQTAPKATPKPDKTKPIAAAPKPAPKPAPKTTAPKATTPDDEDASNDADGGSPTGDTKEGTATTAPTKATTGVSYKIQIASLGANEKFVAEKYEHIQKLGANIETEPGPNGVGTRIVANPSGITADALMKKLKAVGKEGFKVKYVNGVRAQ